MFCKNCGNEIADDSAFCSKCGKTVKEESTSPSFEGETVATGTETVDKQDGTPREEATKPGSGSPGKAAASEIDSANRQERASIDEMVKETVDTTNPLCIAGLVLTVIMFFFNYYCIVGVAAFILSFFGYREAKKNEQKGTALAVVCMAVSGIASLVYFVCLIEYSRYESAVYGGISGFLDLLGDL